MNVLDVSLVVSFAIHAALSNDSHSLFWRGKRCWLVLYSASVNVFFRPGGVAMHVPSAATCRPVYLDRAWLWRVGWRDQWCLFRDQVTVQDRSWCKPIRDGQHSGRQLPVLLCASHMPVGVFPLLYPV